MKNFEKWEKEVLDIARRGRRFAVENGKPVDCASSNCNKCDLSYHKTQDKRSCIGKRIEWLYAEYVEKPKLTKQERKFCELFEGKDYYIARDKEGDLFGYASKPIKGTANEWIENRCFKNGWFNINGVLKYADIKFDFIKWEDKEPWAIDDLLRL